MKQYEYVVVGGGTAGIVIGVRLAEAGHRVAVVEAGPTDLGDPRIEYTRDWASMIDTELDFSYPLVQREGFNPYLREHIAKVLGGCSSHNNTIALRPSRADIAHWNSLCGGDTWTEETVSEAWARVQEKVRFELAPIENRANIAFLEACEQQGLPRVELETVLAEDDLRNVCGVLPLNSEEGRRESSAVAYLHHADELPPTLNVLTGVRVDRILFDSGRAVSVETSAGQIEASEEIIVTAGSLNTPKLLMLSGVGHAEHLNEFGIDVVSDLPVGDHLLDHPESGVLFETSGSPGGMEINGWEVGAFGEDVMIHFTQELYDDYTSLQGYPVSEHGISMTPNVRRAVSEGTVRLRSSDPEDTPVIDAQLLSDEDDSDIDALVAGIRLCREIAAQPAFEGLVVRELAPGTEVQDDEDLKRYIRLAGATVFHPAGTCRMGFDCSTDNVVTPDFKVKGTRALRVADASVLPSMVGVNPCMTVLILAEICAQKILSERR